MARSILPSTRRKGAREDKRINNRKARARVKAEMRRCLRDPDYADEADLFYEPSWSYIVSDRREADKLNHFIRWAEAITQGVPRDDRVKHMRGMLPEGLIGWHAVSHLEFRDHFRTTAQIAERDAWRASWAKNRTRRRTREDNVMLLREVMEDSALHRVFNRAMLDAHCPVSWVTGYKEGKPRTVYAYGGNTYQKPQLIAITKIVGPREGRYCKGLGDIDRFLDDVHEAGTTHREVWSRWTSEHYFRSGFRSITFYRQEAHHRTRANPDYHPEWWRALNRFLDAYAEARPVYPTDLTAFTHEVLGSALDRLSRKMRTRKAQQRLG
jgi:hypothetical protein